MTDLISIILPSHNRAHLIGKAIQSALNQSHREIELIVVDDASTDNTEEVVASFRDSRIVYLRNSSNLKASGARNVGLRKVQGRYVTFLDSDDEYYPDKVSEQYASIRDTDLGAVTCGRDDYLVGQKKSSWVPRIDRNALHHLLARDNVGAGAPFLMIPSQIIRDHDLLFDETMSAMEDHDLLIRICQRFEIAYVPKPLVRVNHHYGERVYNLERSIESHLAQNRKYAHLYQLDPKAKIKNAISLAEKYFQMKQPTEAIKVLQSISVDQSIMASLWWMHFKTFNNPRNFFSRVNLRLLRKATYIT